MGPGSRHLYSRRSGKGNEIALPSSCCIQAIVGREENCGEGSTGDKLMLKPNGRGSYWMKGNF
eukprot:96231-Karenia_brevis.AAC.1